MTKQTDCFASKPNDKCSVLAVEVCEGEYCSFRKTDLELKQELNNTAERIKSLNEEERKHIQEKYGKSILRGVA